MDTEPPKLDSARSSPGMITNFNETRLVFTFDEWFNLNDPFNQILISPEIDPRPEFRVRGKRLLVDIDPTALRESTTYSIFFGASIRDITERNVLENFKYVFSTGDYIDSLYLKFKVIDAFTNEPAEKILVMLYDEFQDSLLMNTRPFYASRTNESGEVQFENLRPGQYYVRALLDQNFSYTYDQPNEKIGFLAAPVASRELPDTTFSIRLFIEPVPFRALFTKQSAPSFLSIALNNKAVRLDSVVTFNPSGTQFDFQFFRDSLWLWTNETMPDSLDIWVDGSQVPFRVRIPATVSDTISSLGVAADPGTTPGRGRGAPAVLPEILREVRKQNMLKPIVLEMQRPIASVDTSLIWLMSDSLRVYGNSRISFSANKIQLIMPWQADSTYTLIIDSAAITDVFGQVNKVLTIQLSILDPAQMGNISIAVSNLNPDRQYLIELISGDAVMQTFCIRNETEFLSQQTGMNTGNYQLRVIEDRIENCTWDTGNYLRKIQPEQIWLSEQANLRANWDMDLHLSVEE